MILKLKKKRKLVKKRKQKNDKANIHHTEWFNGCGLFRTGLKYDNTLWELFYTSTLDAFNQGMKIGAMDERKKNH